MSRREKLILALWLLSGLSSTLPLHMLCSPGFCDEDESSSGWRKVYSGWKRSAPTDNAQSLEGLDSMFAFLFCNAAFLKILRMFRRRRRFWTAPRIGVWEAKFLGAIELLDAIMQIGRTIDIESISACRWTLFKGCTLNMDTCWSVNLHDCENQFHQTNGWQ